MSFSNNKTSISPLKPAAPPFTTTPPNLSSTKYPLNRLPPPSLTISFISNLCLKLKEKYSSTAQGLKKLSEQHPSEIPILQFRKILHELKLNYTEKEFKEFFRIYGKTQKSSNFIGITIDSLTKCVHSSASPQKKPPKCVKKESLTKTLNFSTRSSSRVLRDLNFSLHSHQLDQYIGLKKCNFEVFVEHLLEIFGTPEGVTDYFFVGREDFLGFEDFFESIQCLGLEKNYSDLKDLFSQLSQNEKFTKEDFFVLVFGIGCKEKGLTRILTEFRERLHKTFDGYFSAFQEITEGESCLSPSKIEKAAELVGMGKEKDTIVTLLSEDYPKCCLYFKDFKRFWLGKDGVCAIKFCEELPLDSFSYCKTHIQCLSNRGEEIYTKLQLILKKPQLLSLIQEVLTSTKSKLFLVNGFELHKKDSLAFKEFLILHKFPKRPSSNSVKSRV